MEEEGESHRPWWSWKNIFYNHAGRKSQSQFDIFNIRWDIWDIEEGDESTASPVTHSPLATCPRVTPLDCVDREETLDELSSGLDDEEEEEETEEALTARNVFESMNVETLAGASNIVEGGEVKVFHDYICFGKFI